MSTKSLIVPQFNKNQHKFSKKYIFAIYKILFTYSNPLEA